MKTKVFEEIIVKPSQKQWVAHLFLKDKNGEDWCLNGLGETAQEAVTHVLAHYNCEESEWVNFGAKY